MEDRSDLNSLTVLSPCKADWEKMPGDAATRFCERCGKRVHNLSARASAEANAFIHEADPNTCVRFHRDATGALITLDYAPAKDAKTARRWIAVIALLSSALSAGVIWPARTTMGRMAPRPCTLPPPPTQPLPASAPTTLPD